MDSMFKKWIKKFSRNMQEFDVTLEELKLKQAKGAIIIDVRNQREYSEGHISQSINIPEYEIKYKTLVGMIKLIIEKETTYCSIQSVKDLIEVFEKIEGEKENGTN